MHLRNGTGAPVYGLLIRQSGTNATTAAATGGQHQHLQQNQQQLAASAATLAPALPPAPTVLVQRDAAGINMRRVEPAPVGRRPYPVILPRRNNVTATPVNVNSLFIPTATVQQVHLQPAPQIPQAPALPQAQAVSQTQQTAPMIASCHVNPTGAYHQTMSMDNSNHMLVDNSYG
ncbi:putative site-specific recombinase, phage integrase family, partial [Trichinella spiralis]|uniref:putative site-specific recombinase, phage integrase family n=1 Tax=Trichinella spiralis TaxID=6334 RepID=UPI0001EFEA24